MTDRLAALFHALQSAGLDLDAESALDGVWLGLQMATHRAVTESPGGTARPAVPTAQADGSSAGPQDGETSEDGATADAPAVPRTDRFRVPGASRTSTGSAPARTLTLARAAALPESRDLIRSLRPLRRRVVSPGTGVIDIDTTVRRAAEEDLWVPSFASARERWLDVLLVADHGLSMIIWKDTIDEFERVLRNCGAFRSVRSWWLESDTDSPSVSTRGRGQSPATPERLTRLVRGEGRSVMLVLSDCVGARWHDGDIPRLVSRWSRAVPVALMQVTPEWFWARTALGDTVGSRFRSVVPATVNRRLRWDSSALGPTTSGENDSLLRLPATTLTADAVARVAGLMAGVGREWAPGVVFDLTWEQEESAGGPAATADERVARFRALASPSALRLAAAFAASPVRTLGVLRLLRRDLVRDAHPFAEAEVLLGGIVRVRREDARWDLGGGLPLEMIPGVQSLLLDGAVAGDVLRVLELAAAEAKEGVGPTFMSWLREPAAGTGQLDPDESAFAAAAAEALSRLGGAYARVVKAGPRTEAASPSEEREEAASSARSWSGGPHDLPTAELLGREPEQERVEAWLNGPAQGMLALVGPPGIGKTAIAADAITRWRRRTPAQEPFVWSFHRDAGVLDARRALTSFIVRGSPVDAPDAVGIPRPMELSLGQEGPPRLVVLDGLDAISDPAALGPLLDDVILIAGSRGARVLLASRNAIPGTGLPQPVTVAALNRAAAEALARRQVELLVTAGATPRSTEEVAATVTLAQFAAGNPGMIQTLVSAAFTLGADVVAEELQLQGDHPLDPGSIDAVTTQLKNVERARELTAQGVSREADDPRGALKALDEVMDLRATLPSRLLRGQALHYRGRVSLSVGEFDRAGADLADAVGIFRTISAQHELVLALEGLAQVRSETGRQDEAMALLREASEIARATSNWVAVPRVQLRLVSLLMERGDLEGALHAVAEALEFAERTGNARVIGPARLQQAHIHLLTHDTDAALEGALIGLQHARAVEDAVLEGAAHDVIAGVHEATGNVAEAREALERLRALRPGAASEIDERIRRITTSQAASNRPAPEAATPADDDAVVTQVFEISGRLQGVGFRSFAEKQARELGLTGSAQNLPDGRVRVEATGPLGRLRQLEQRLRKGPSTARVSEVVVRRIEGATTPPGEHAAPSAPPRSWAEDSERAVISIGIGRIAGLPRLPAATAAARDVVAWAVDSQRVPSANVHLFTDDERPVTLTGVHEAVESLVAKGTLRQLIVYLAGYAVNLRYNEILLLSGAPADASAAVNVAETVNLARWSGIEHVVLITDTCRVAAESIGALGIAGGSLFPAVAPSQPAGAVDLFSGVALGAPALEPRDAGEAVRGYQAVFTRVLLPALRGEVPSLVSERNGVRCVTPRHLGEYLKTEAPRALRGRGLHANVLPDVRIESEPDSWLARFPPASG